MNTVVTTSTHPYGPFAHSAAIASGLKATTAPSKPRGLRAPRRLPPHRALFLDFDGVLHPTSDVTTVAESVVRPAHFGWIPVLASVIEPHPDVHIVVHSTWRYTHDVDELRALLGVLGPRVLGVTPRGPRYESIVWWLHLNPAFTDYRVLDDASSEFPTPPPSELILCDPQQGVSEARVVTELGSWLSLGRGE